MICLCSNKIYVSILIDRLGTIRFKHPTAYTKQELRSVKRDFLGNDTDILIALYKFVH